MNEIDYGALFGIDEGGKEQEAAEPAQSQEEQAQGEEVQEAADPAEEDQDNTQQTTGADDQASEEDAGGEQPEGNTETGSEGAQDVNARNAQFAAARRKAEAERDAADCKGQRGRQSGSAAVHRRGVCKQRHDEPVHQEAHHLKGGVRRVPGAL